MRPGLEPLEDRTVLTTILMVDSLLDDGVGETLRDAIGQANSGSDTEYVIEFSPLVRGAITLTQGELALANTNSAVAGKTIAIAGPGASQLTVSGNHASRVFSIAAGVSVTFAGLTITGGRADSGGGIFNGGTLMLTAATLSGNSASLGGGLNNVGTVTVTDSTLSGNSAGFGGNSAGFGGGIYSYGTLTLTNSTLSGNSAVTDGGGLYNEGTATVTDSTLSGNSAEADGGGLSNFFGATVTLANSTLSGNSAEVYGGGISNLTGGTVTLANSTLSGNSAEADGGGIYNFIDGTVTLTNTIIARNQAVLGPDLHGAMRSQGHNLIGDATGSAGWVGTDLTGAAAAPLDPLLGPLQDNGGPTQTMALLPGSPAIDAGDDALASVLDQRGTQRGPAGLNAGGHTDIGAYEASSSYLVTSAADSTAVGTLRTAVGWANRSSNANPANVADPAPNTVRFDISGLFAQPQTITLSRGELLLSNTATPTAIAGPGASQLAVSGNHASGVFSIAAGVSVTLAGLTITEGAADFGGGVFNRGTVTVTDSTLSGNSASIGGGIFNEGTVTLTDSTLSGNSATDGGGIVNDVGTVTVTDSTLSGNSASASGGGIYNIYGTVTVTDSTLSGNSAYAVGGGIVNDVGPVTLANTIIARNQANAGPDVYGSVSSQGHNLIGDTTGSDGWVGTDLTGTAAAPLDPRLGPLQDNGGPTWTMALLPGSPAIDGGAAVAGLTTDQRGIARPQGSAFDIGAFESRGFVLTVVSGGNQSTPVGQAFGQPLVVRVSSPFGEPVEGGVVGFTAPDDGASATPAAVGVVITGGTASLPVVANHVAGSYEVTASASGASQPASFGLVNTPGAPVRVIRVSGPGSTATVATSFAEPLIVLVTDAYDNPVSGATVTFAAPSTGAGATFGGSATMTATTDGSGLAAVQVTANTVAGAYAITATSASAALSLNLTNTPGAPARIAGVSGAPQAATVNTAFAEPLVVLVTDAYDNPVPGATVTFAAPDAGASASFGGSATFTATTDAAGRATAQAAANTAAGSYSVTASVAGVTTPAAFALTNTAGAAVRIASMGGTPQSTVVATAFAEPLVVLVTDAYDNPVPGATVTFAAPGAGAGASFDGATITDAAGLVKVTATANTVAGSYSVIASVAGVTVPAAFALTNTPDEPAQVSAIGGTPQAAVVNTAFAQPLRVRVSDQYGNAVPGAMVAFVTPGSGPGASLSSAIATTDASGEAAVTATANTAVGGYAVTASLETGAISARAVAGTTVAAFALTNTPGAPTRITATSGTPQSAAVAAPFAQPLMVLVTDEYGNPAPGVAVTFAAPAAGAGASLATSVATTDAAGLASVLATANAQAGPYAVTASVAGLAPVALFALANTPIEPPAVVGLSRFGFHEQTTQLVLSFDQALDPGPAQVLGNYLLQGPGRDGRLGTRDDVAITIGSATYDPAARTVTLVPAGRLLKLRQRYRLTVNGTAPGGLTSVVGIPLTGSPGGVPGTDYVARFNKEALAGASDAFGADGPSQAGRRRAAEARRAANPLLRQAGVAGVIAKALGRFRARPHVPGGRLP